MAIIEQVDYSLFEQRFVDMDRRNHFPTGLRDLYDYLEQVSDDVGEDLQLDVIALCVEFCELSIEDALKETGCESLDDLEGNTLVIHVDDDTIIYQTY